MFDAIIIITAFVVGFLSCYFYMTTGVDQGDK